ncbi:unnamed protein product [Soboliphyme baturini]|uniref:Uncharacterized protein n=1 Tax=Soboliphyme baturini TaxID=241478 RepID=A0A183IC94_9BILA|nr:unnamed protein product [Soboliphyme baturini]
MIASGRKTVGSSDEATDKWSSEKTDARNKEKNDAAVREIKYLSSRDDAHRDNDMQEMSFKKQCIVNAAKRLKKDAHASLIDVLIRKSLIEASDLLKNSISRSELQSCDAYTWPDMPEGYVRRMAEFIEGGTIVNSTEASSWTS